jgi:hypothetical protein
MQNRYVGDIGDYVKLAILRRLAFGRSLGVAWWLFPNEHHNSDGAHREYLRHRNKWAHFDPDLFEALLKIENEKNWDVRAFEEAAILPNTVFASKQIPCERGSQESKQSSRIATSSSSIPTTASHRKD